MNDLGEVATRFHRDGFARLGVMFDEARLDALRLRADDLMLGRVAYDGMFFQHDAETGRYEDLVRGEGYRGPSLDYRKIEKLELDPTFRAHVEDPRFERIVRHFIDGPVSIYRAVLFNKSARGGSPLPWHQDGGAFWGVTPRPFLQIWTALDDCDVASGCLRALPGSHQAGLASPLGGVIQPQRLADCEARALHLTARSGEVILLHNDLWHAAAVNTSGRPRRTLSICYMSAATRCLRTRRAPRSFARVFASRTP